MSADNKKTERFGEEPKIKPRQVAKPEAEEEETSDEPRRRRRLEKKADEEWLAKLKPLESAKPSEIRDTKDSSSQKEEIGAASEKADGRTRQESEFIDESSEASEAGDSDEWEDGLEDAASKPAQDESMRKRRRKVTPFPKLSPAFIWRWVKVRAVMLVSILFGLVVFAAIFWKLGESRGYQEGRKISLREEAIEESKRILELPPEAQQRLDAALLSLRDGNTGEPARELAALAEAFPDVPSLNYAAGLGAIQAGDLEGTEKFARRSISKNEKVSDSLVLLSIVESQKGAQQPDQQFGDPRLRTKKLLQEAVAADPMNAGARMELGSLFRYMGDEQGAIKELRSAKARLHPVDSHLSVDVTVALIEVENLPLDVLTPTEPERDDVRALFPAAYVAMRHDNFELGARLLKRCQNLLSPDTFHYLVNDRAFRRFSYRPELKEFQGE